MAEEKCKNCGQLFDPDLNPRSFGFGTSTSGYHCSYHPAAPVLTDDEATGAREGYVEVWKFPCCGELQMGGEFDLRSLPPPKSPGCKVGPHEADQQWRKQAKVPHVFDVFLSFNSEDEAHARKVHTFLNEKGVRVFFSRESIPQLAEAAYMDAIHDALEKAHHLIVVTGTPESTKRGWVRSEWSIFLNELRSERKQGNVVVVLAGGEVAELPIALRAQHVVPLSAAGLDELLRFVA